MLGGYDFTAGKIGFSPYTGIGYRNLYNDLSGSQVDTFRVGGNTITERVYGYGRDSQYLYLPIGVTPRFRVTDTGRISTNFEYDYLIKGWQTDNFSDITPAYPDLTNTQDTGFGLRGSLMYEEASWSIGPFFNYWNINRSDANYGYGAIRPGYYEYEPHNQTLEYGLQGRYRF